MSPTIGMSARMFLPISAGSMSMWMTFACAAIWFGAATARSPTRAPHRMIRSASRTARFA